MNNENGMFNGLFRHLGEGMCRLGINGELAVKTSGGYKTYNVETGDLTNVTQFCFDVGSEMFFVVPTMKAKKGDILLIDARPKCVIENNGKTIEVMDYETSAIQKILPERHVFMGKTYFYRKIVSMFGSGNFLKGAKGMNKLMKIMMMKEMFKGVFGGNSCSSNNSGFGGMLPFMFMSNMFGGNGGGNDMAEMFDLDFDFDNESDDEVEEAPAKKPAAKKGK